MSIIMFIIMYPLLCNARLRMANGEWRMADGLVFEDGLRHCDVR